MATGCVVLAGEITSKGNVDYNQVAREVIKDIGYDDSEMGFDYKSCAILVALGKQSADIAMGVDGQEQGAGDQGIMFGYACNETPEYMPASISLSHKLMSELATMRKNKVVHFLRPDSKSQVTVEYKNGKASRIDTIVVSTQHTPDVDQSRIREFVIDQLVSQGDPGPLD